MSAIKAIETRYAGCHFRSRLEARWAVFFDHLGVAWEYEPQGFAWEAKTIKSPWGRDEELQGGLYLPDFWLPSISTWFEVKGNEQTNEESRVHFEFSLLTGQRHITACGDIPRDVDSLKCNGGSESMYLDGECDFHYLWCVCPWCKKPGIAFDGRGARVCGFKAHHETEEAAWADPRFDSSKHWRVDDKCYTFDDQRILAAYLAARSARFEHGRSGST